MMQDRRPFADILDECLDRVLFMGEDAETCLADYPDHISELRESLMTAGALRGAATALQPSTAGRRASRQRFLEALDKRRNARPWWRPSWAGVLVGTWPRLAATVGVFVAVLAGTGTGTAFASQSAIPGDALYPVKQVVEQTELALASGNQAVQVRTDLLNTRVQELAAVTQLHRDQFVPGLVQQISAESDQINQMTAEPVTQAIEHISSGNGGGGGPAKGGGAGPKDVTQVSVSSVLALNAQLDRLKERIASMQGKAKNPHVQQALSQALAHLEENQKSLNAVLDRADSLLQQTSGQGNGTQSSGAIAGGTPSALGTGSGTTGTATPAPSASPSSGPPKTSDGNSGQGNSSQPATERIVGRIEGVVISADRGGAQVDIQLRLDDGSVRDIHVNSSSQAHVGQGRAAKLADYALGARVEALVTRKGGAVRALHILTPGQGASDGHSDTSGGPTSSGTPTQARGVPGSSGPPSEHAQVTPTIERGKGQRQG